MAKKTKKVVRKTKVTVAKTAKAKKSAKTTKTAKATKSAKTPARGARKVARRPYSRADIKELRAHSKARTPVATIARLTKRTVGSLRQKAMKLGIGLGHQR